MKHRIIYIKLAFGGVKTILELIKQRVHLDVTDEWQQWQERERERERKRERESKGKRRRIRREYYNCSYVRKNVYDSTCVILL